MSDLIDRQAAIDEIDEWIKAFLENGHKESAADACLIQDGIIQLPSVQSEIIRCKDCKHKHIEKSVWTCPFGLSGGSEFFCGYGAETRGEEHEDIPIEYYENGGI